MKKIYLGRGPSNSVFRVPLADLPKELREQIESQMHGDEEEEEEVPAFFKDLFDNGDEKALEDRGVIVINQDISKQSLARASAKLWALHFNQKWNDQVQIILNSPGGYMDGCWAFIDTMNAVRMPIRTVAVGTIASAATMIFINGDERVMTPNSQAMIHHFSSINWGSYPALVAARKSEDMEFDRMIQHFIRCSRMKTKEQVEKNILLVNDNWLSPKEMKALGLCDRVLPNTKHGDLEKKPRKRK